MKERKRVKEWMRELNAVINKVGEKMGWEGKKRKMGSEIIEKEKMNQKWIREREKWSPP